MRRSSPSRPGFTLIEVLVVLAILIVFAAVAAPTVWSLTRDTNVKAAADLVRARASEARAAAVGENRTYRVSLSPDGLRVRVAPDDTAFDTLDLDGAADVEPPTTIEDVFPTGVTAELVQDGVNPAVTDADGWVRVATFKPDGTARQDAVVQVNELGVRPLWVRVRGLTGATTVTRPTDSTARAGAVVP